MRIIFSKLTKEEMKNLCKDSCITDEQFKKLSLVRRLALPCGTCQHSSCNNVKEV